MPDLSILWLPVLSAVWRVTLMRSAAFSPVTALKSPVRRSMLSEPSVAAISCCVMPKGCLLAWSTAAPVEPRPNRIEAEARSVLGAGHEARCAHRGERGVVQPDVVGRLRDARGCSGEAGATIEAASRDAQRAAVAGLMRGAVFTLQTIVTARMATTTPSETDTGIL
jgi:hypothetical protein